MWLNKTYAMFDGVKIKVSVFLPDNEMYISRNTFNRMRKWFADNHPMTEISEADFIRKIEVDSHE